MDKQVVFKTSAIGGFDKKAVLDYIYRLNEESSTIQTKMREEIDTLGKTRQSLEESIRQQNEKLLLLQRELDEVKDDISHERSQMNELIAENDGLQGEIMQQREQMAQVRRERENTEGEMEKIQAQNRELQANKDEADKAIAGMGKLMLDARMDADRIISSANEQSEEILAAANTEADDIRARAQEVLDSARSETENELERIRAEVLEETKTQREEARREADGVLALANEKAEAINIEADAAVFAATERFAVYTDAAEGVQSAIAKMLEGYNAQAAELTRDMKASLASYDDAIAEIRSRRAAEQPLDIGEPARTETAENTDEAYLYTSEPSFQEGNEYIEETAAESVETLAEPAEEEEQDEAAWPRSAWVQPEAATPEDEEKSDDDFFRSPAERE